MDAKNKALIEKVEHMDAEVLRGAVNFDETASAYLARQLTYIRARNLQVPHARLNAFDVFPVQTEVPAGAQTALQRVYDMVGMAKIISNPADDLPYVDVLAEETSVKVKELGVAYGYSVSDLEAAAFARLPLSTMKASAARRAVDTAINKLAWFGDGSTGSIGFINNPNVSEYILPADGKNNSTKFADKTAEQMYKTVAEILDTIPNNTDDTVTANTFLMSPSVYTALSMTLYTSDNGQTTQTVLAMLKSNYPEVTRWMKVGELKNADSTGTKDIVIAGFIDPSVIRLEIPLRFAQEPLQRDNLYMKIPCRSKAIGVTVNQPYCFTKAVGA